MAVADELVARLKGVPGVAAVFDALPVNYNYGPSPVISLHDITLAPLDPRPIDGELAGNEERWQVSVRGTHLAKVRAVVRSVVDVLDGFSTSTIVSCAWESGGAAEQESDRPLVFHAPVDFTILT